MIYKSAQDWRDATHKRVLLFGMSGLGKTHLSNMLRQDGGWFHYSVDYRIGTRYMGELIADNAKMEAMKVPFLAEMLKSDSIYIASNITFDNLAPLSAYLGKPGDPAKGGLPIEEYRKRQAQHARAEIAAMMDTGHFIDRAERLYGYRNFVCDTSGSICEVVNPDDPHDPVLKALSETTLMVWIRGSDGHTDELIRRFNRAPKPMYYHPDFLEDVWSSYLTEFGQTETTVDPDAFIRFAYGEAMHNRQPLYQGMAYWGITVEAADVAAVKIPQDFEEMIARALPEG